MTVDNNTTTVVFGHSLDSSFALPLAIYFIALTIAGIVCNLVLIYTIVTVRKLQTTTNYFIVNLAICDSLHAALVIPFDAELLLRHYYKHSLTLCAFKEVAFMFSLPSSVVNLLLLTLERFITITFSFKHRKIFRKRNVFILIAVAWIYTLVVALIPIMQNPNAIQIMYGLCFIRFTYAYAYYQLSANFLFPVLCIVIFNILLFRIANGHEQSIRSLSSHDSNRNSSAKRNNSTIVSSVHTMVSYLANMKAAKTILLLVGVFLICWVTYLGMVVASIVCDGCYPSWFIWIGNGINYLSIVLNPLLYGIRSKSIRKVMKKKIFEPLFRRNNNYLQSNFSTVNFHTTHTSFNSPPVNARFFDADVDAYIKSNDVLEKETMLL